MSDPCNRRAYDAGYDAFLNGNHIRDGQWDDKKHHWTSGYTTAEADAQRNTLQTKGEMPEEQQTWLRNNLKLERDFYPAAPHGIIRFHLKLGDDTLSTLEFHL